MSYKLYPPSVFCAGDYVGFSEENAGCIMGNGFWSGDLSPISSCANLGTWFFTS